MKKKLTAILAILLLLLNVSSHAEPTLDKGAELAYTLISQIIGEKSPSTLGERGVKEYVESHGIDPNKDSLNVEIYSGFVVLETKATNGNWVIFIWSDITEKDMTTIQKGLLEIYDELLESCTRGIQFGFVFSGKDNSLKTIRSSKEAKQEYKAHFDSISINSSGTKEKYTADECKAIAVNYMKKHTSKFYSSVQLGDITALKDEENHFYIFTIPFSAWNTTSDYTSDTYYCEVDYTTGEVLLGGTI